MNSDSHVFFQRRAEELFRSLGDQLSAREVADLRTSIEEGNHSEVIRTIAWIVEKKDSPVSRSTKLKICELSRDLVDLRDMPESFRDMLLEESKG